MTPSYLNIRGSYAVHAAIMGSRNPVVTMHRSVPVRKGVWGPHLWKFFHAVGHRLSNIPDLDTRCKYTKAMWEHTQALIQSIPCPSCRNHALSEYRATRYTDPDDKQCDWYQQWAFQFHNKVNGRLHKKNVSWDDAVKLSSSYDATDQLQLYITSINGWRYNKMDNLVSSIKSLLVDM